MTLPERRREDLPDDLDYMVRADADPVYIAISSKLSDEEAHVAAKEAWRAYTRDRRRDGVFALPLAGIDQVRRASKQHAVPAAAGAAAAAAVAVVAAVGILLQAPPHHGTSRALRQHSPGSTATTNPGTPVHQSPPAQPPVPGPGRVGVPVVYKQPAVGVSAAPRSAPVGPVTPHRRPVVKRRPVRKPPGDPQGSCYLRVPALVSALAGIPSIRLKLGTVCVRT